MKAWLFSILAGLTLTVFVGCNNSNEAKPSNGVASLQVENHEAIPFDTQNEWKDAPDFLADAKIYSKLTSKSGERLRFSAETDGIVLAVIKLTFIVDTAGAKKETGLEDSAMMSDGWLPLGQLNRVEKNGEVAPYRLYRRQIMAGDRFDVALESESHPILVSPSSDHLARILAARLEKGGDPALRNEPKRPPREKREYEDQSIGDAVLIGLRISVDKAYVGYPITAIQPLYESGEGVNEGEIHGQQGGNIVEVRAKPNYAVGGIVHSLDKRGLLMGLRLIFLRRTDKGLDRADAYESRWVGNTSEEDEGRIGPTDRPYRGIKGKVSGRLQTLEMIGGDE